MRGTPLQIWLRAQAAVWLPCLVAVAVAGPHGLHVPVAIVAAALMVVSYALLVHVLGSARRAAGRAADVATIARFAGAAVLLSTADASVSWVRWLGWALVAAADLVDGALARRFGGSPEGAVLDMETDQFLVLALSLQAVLLGIGAHVLVLPALRYVFVAAAWCLRFRADEPKPVRGDNRRGRLVCAAVVVALLAAILPGVSLFAANVVVALAGVLLAWSFAADVGHLLRHVRRAEFAE